MVKLLSFFGGLKGYAIMCLIAAAIAAGASWYVTSLPYKAQIANMRAERAEQSAANAQAALAQFTRQAGNITAAAHRLAVAERGIDAVFASASKDFSRYASLHPLPADCKPDAFRVRDLVAAVAAANAAATGREAVGRLPPNQ